MFANQKHGNSVLLITPKVPDATEADVCHYLLTNPEARLCLYKDVDRARSGFYSCVFVHHKSFLTPLLFESHTSDVDVCRDLSARLVREQQELPYALRSIILSPP